MATVKETSGYNQSKRPVTDPTHIFTSVSGATDSATPSTLTYTTATAHNFVVGQPVVIYGFANSAYNFASDTTVFGTPTSLGAGRPAVITAVGSTTTFSVKATAQVTTAGVSGFVLNDANDSNSPWDTTWLPTQTAADSASNYQIGLEWGDSFPIQPNDARVLSPGATDRTTSAISATAASAVVANGSTITYTTLAAHGLVAGSRITIDGLLPAQFNYNDVVVSSAPSSTTFTIATTATGTYDYANSFGLIAAINSTGGNAQAVATSAVGPIQVSNVTATSGAALITYNSTAHGLITGQYATISGMLPNGLNISGNITRVDADNFTIASTANPGTSTKSGSASVLSNSYTTQQVHNLTAGQDTSITGASLTEYNVSGLVVSTASTKIVNVNAAKLPGNAASTAPVTVSGTAVTYVLASGHNATTSDSASVYGYVGGANLNTVGNVAISAVTANSITINTPAVLSSIATSTIGIASSVTTYTTANTFKPGQIVSVSGFGGANAAVVNVNSVIISATAGAFTVSSGATSSATLSGTATISVAATTAAVAIAGVTAVAAYDAASITLTMPNNFVVGQPVTVAGLTGGTNYNTTGTVTVVNPGSVKIGYPQNTSLGSTAPAVVATSNAVTVASVALPVSGTTSADASKIGFLVKKGGTFVSPAYVGNSDASWGVTNLVPSVQLSPNLDNHEIVRDSRVGYPDFFPKYSVPNVVGKTYTNAIQALKAAGLDGAVGITAMPSGVTVNGAVSAGSTSITATGTVTAVLGATISGTGIAPGTTVTKVASQVLTLSIPTTASTPDTTALTFTAPPAYLAISGATVSGSVVTYTVASTSTLNVGDVVTIANIFDSVNTTGAPNTNYNRNLVQIATIPNTTTFTVNLVNVSGTYSASGTVTPFSTVVTSQSPAAGTNTLTEGTNSKVVTLTRYAGY